MERERADPELLRELRAAQQDIKDMETLCQALRESLGNLVASLRALALPEDPHGDQPLQA